MPKILVIIHSVHRVKKRNANLQSAFLFLFHSHTSAFLSRMKICLHECANNASKPGSPLDDMFDPFTDFPCHSGIVHGIKMDAVHVIGDQVDYLA